MASELSRKERIESALNYYNVKDSSKIIVRFQSIGNTPIMKQNFYQITASSKFKNVILFLRKKLDWKDDQPLVSFSPFLQSSNQAVI
jgi:ubiquitin-like protein ATG12